MPNEKALFESAQNEESKGHFDKAVEIYDKISKRFPGEELAMNAAREAEHITFFELKDFKKSAEYLRYLIVHSNDPRERVQAQKRIADLYFTQMSDYQKAELEINRLLSMEISPEEKAKYKMNLVRAYFFENNFVQAENEVDEYLRETMDDKTHFDLLTLKGNIFLAKKDISGAIEIYKDIIKKFPKRAEEENLALTLAICYEELNDYRDAIAMLEELKRTHPMPEYVDIRIKKLLEREKNAPKSKQGPRRSEHPDTGADLKTGKHDDKAEE